MAMSDSERLAMKWEVTKIRYKWEIPNFAEKVSKHYWIEGPTINARGTNVYWKLKMYSETDSDGFLRVGVHPSTNGGTDSKIQVCLDACICDANDTKVFNEEFTEVAWRFWPVGKAGHKWKLLREQTVLGDPQRFLPDGKLTVLCIFHYVEPKYYTHVADHPVVPPSEIVSWMENVLAGGKFSDVVVAVEDREFPVHRAVLAERSDVFQRMFDAPMMEQHTKRVAITDFSADVVSDLLTFVYTDTAPNVATLAPGLLVAAQKYNIPRLKAVCEAELANSLNTDNIYERLAEAEMYNANQLKDAALLWICKHAPDLVETAAFKSFCEQHPELVTSVFKKFVATYVMLAKYC